MPMQAALAGETACYEDNEIGETMAQNEPNAEAEESASSNEADEKQNAAETEDDKEAQSDESAEAMMLQQPMLGGSEPANTKNIVDSISITMKGSDPSVKDAERDGKEYLAYDSSLAMTIKLKYDPQIHGALKQGDKLKIDLKTVEPANSHGSFDNYVTFHGSSSHDGDFNGTVDGSGESKKIADLKFLSDGIVLSFVDFNEPFTGSINLAYAKRSDYNIEDYFKDNPDKDKLNFTLRLNINDEAEDRFVKLTIDKPQVVPPTAADLKKIGSFWPEDNNFLYNVKAATKLTAPNELLIFDTPDINLEFNSDLKFFVTKTANDNAGESVIYSVKGFPTSYYNMTKKTNDPGTASADDCQMWLYDLYYLVDDVSDDKAVPMAEYEERKIKLTHPLLAEEDKESIEVVSQPKNILFWVPTGQELSAEQQEQIENAGGLGKKVGKGFFIRAYNLQNPHSSLGTYFRIVYDMDMVRESPVKNDKNDPLYFNSLSYYIQEIPNCPEGATCTPISAERSKMGDSNRGGKLNHKAAIFYSSYDADISPFKSVNILKVDDKGQAVEGAEFTIYKLNDDGSRGEIAKNSMNSEMTNLITDANGKLVHKDTKDAARVYLAKGKYQLVETVVPESYKSENLTTDFEVKDGSLELEIINIKEATGETPEPTPDVPNDKEPDKPGTTKPDKPENTSKPENPKKPENTSKPSGTTAAGPKTGENALTTLWISSAILSAAILLIIKRLWLRGPKSFDI